MSNVVPIRKGKTGLNAGARPRYLSGVFAAAVTSTRGRAAKKKVPCALEIADLVAIWESQKGLCALSGVPMTWGQGPASMTSVSVDRIQPKKGYVRKNVRLVCFGLNSLRLAGTDREAYVLAKAFVQQFESRGI